MLLISVAIASTLPKVQLENQKGKLVSTDSLVKGKPLVILFWSTTCKPCIMELKAINEQLEDWQEEVDFDIVAVSIDDSRSFSKAKAMANGFGWDFTCLYDKNQDFKRAMNVSLIPQSFIVDANGEVIWSHSGYNIGGEQEILDKLLEIAKK
jgi:Thiol-disulfide isomerase and thioredoxins